MKLDRKVGDAQSAISHVPESYDAVSPPGLVENFQRDQTAYAQMQVQAKIFRGLDERPVQHVELAPHDEKSKVMPIEVFVILLIIGLSYVNAAWIFNII